MSPSPGDQAGNPGADRAPRPGLPARPAFAARRRRDRAVAAGSIAAVLAVVVGLVAYKAASGGGGQDKASTSGATATTPGATATTPGATGQGFTTGSSPPGTGAGQDSPGGAAGDDESRRPVPAATLAVLTSVPLGTLARAGQSEGAKLRPAQEAVGGMPGGPGEPGVLYIGAEFCPYCAAERWPMIVALSKFGVFTGLSATRSALQDGDIPTFSFYGAGYSSPYLRLETVEYYSNQVVGSGYGILQQPTPAQSALWSANEKEQAFPFLDVGGRYVLTSSQFDPSPMAGASFADVVGALGDNTTPLGLEIDASAAVLVRYLCDATGGRPGAVCSAMSQVQLPRP